MGGQQPLLFSEFAFASLYFKNIKSFLKELMHSEQGTSLSIFYPSQLFLKLNVYHSKFTTAVNSEELT